LNENKFTSEASSTEGEFHLEHTPKVDTSFYVATKENKILKLNCKVYLVFCRALCSSEPCYGAWNLSWICRLLWSIYGCLRRGYPRNTKLLWTELHLLIRGTKLTEPSCTLLISYLLPCSNPQLHNIENIFQM